MTLTSLCGFPELLFRQGEDGSCEKPERYVLRKEEDVPPQRQLNLIYNMTIPDFSIPQYGPHSPP